jgi:hypothetical protein
MALEVTSVMGPAKHSEHFKDVRIVGVEEGEEGM